jgi:tetratricopeptide (TPR) repeat protein
MLRAGRISARAFILKLPISLKNIGRAAGLLRRQPEQAPTETPLHAAEPDTAPAPPVVEANAPVITEASQVTALAATGQPPTPTRQLDPVDWCTSLADLERYLHDAQAQAPDEAGPLQAAVVWACENQHWEKGAMLAVDLTERFPDVREGYEFGSRALRRSGRDAEADALLATAVERFTDALWPLTQAAAVAHAAKAWERAAELAAIMRTRFPNDLAGHLVGVQSLRQLRQFAAAEALLAPASIKFPNDDALLIEAAWLAQQSANWAAGITRTETLRARHPRRQIGYRIGATCEIASQRYEAAGEILAAALQAFGAQDWILADQARLAARAGDIQATDEKWAQLRTAFPMAPDGYLSGATTKRDLGDVASADALLQEAVRKFPHNKEAHQNFAQIAEARQDWQAAEHRWAAARAAFPADPRISLSWATLPFRTPGEGRESWAEAFVRLRGYHFMFPDAVGGYTTHVQFLCRARRFDEARAICNDAMPRFPNDAALAMAYGQLLEDTQCLGEAAEHYQRLLQHQPNTYLALTRLAAVLSKQGHHAAADDTCAKIMAAYPLRPEAYRTYAHMAMRRQDWIAAQARWLDAAQRFPADQVIQEYLHYTRLALVGSGAEQNTAPDNNGAKTPSHGGAQIAAAADLAIRFESLGGSGLGCEFGMVQRAMGAEPLGLLRWAQTNVAQLVAALDCEFEGVGTPDQTVLDYYLHDHSREEHSDPEYSTADTRFGMRTHTFIRKSQITAEEMHLQSCRRIRFLKRKFIEDLQAGSKIFVFKIAERTLTDQEIDELHAALRRSARNTLLYVRRETPDHPAGTATLVKDGLIIGYIDHFTVTPAGEPLPPSLPAWISICRQAWHLHTASLSEQIDALA